MPWNQYSDYGPQYQYDGSTGFPRERDGQPEFYQNSPLQQQQQQRPGGYYGNEGHQPPCQLTTMSIQTFFFLE